MIEKEDLGAGEKELRGNNSRKHWQGPKGKQLGMADLKHSIISFKFEKKFETEIFSLKTSLRNKFCLKWPC